MFSELVDELTNLYIEEEVCDKIRLIDLILDVC